METYAIWCDLACAGLCVGSCVVDGVGPSDVIGVFIGFEIPAHTT